MNDILWTILVTILLLTVLLPTTTGIFLLMFNIINYIRGDK